MASPAGQRSTITLDGTRATLWSLTTGGGRYQTLYDPDIHGVAVAISLSPAPGSGKLGGVLGVFHDMHLLGSNVRGWTTNPRR